MHRNDKTDTDCRDGERTAAANSKLVEKELFYGLWFNHLDTSTIFILFYLGLKPVPREADDKAGVSHSTGADEGNCLWRRENGGGSSVMVGRGPAPVASLHLMSWKNPRLKGTSRITWSIFLGKA